MCNIIILFVCPTLDKVTNFHFILSKFYFGSRISRIFEIFYVSGNFRRIWWYVVIGNFSYSRKSSKVKCFRQFHGRNTGITVTKGGKMASILLLYRICMICIWIDWKFSSEFNGVHLEVIRGHLKGQKRSFWGQKSEMWPNAHDMHINRFKILFWF